MNNDHRSRILIGQSAAVLLAAGAIHAAAFPAAAPIIDQATLPSSLRQAYKALWLVDSTNLTTLALLYAFVAFRPSAMSREAVLLSALAPLAGAILLYSYMGNFFAGHLMLVSWALATVGAMLRDRARGAMPMIERARDSHRWSWRSRRSSSVLTQ